MAAGRKNKPKDGEKCLHGHDNWLETKAGRWLCRDCRNMWQREYMKHYRAHAPEAAKKQQTARTRTYRERHPEKYEEAKKRAARRILEKRAKDRAEQDKSE